MRERFRRKLFQFHEGPIKTLNLPPFSPAPYLFQFHEGPIKTARADNYLSVLYFVSIP